MSHIPQAKAALKPPTKVHKPIQGGGGPGLSPASSATGLVKPRGTSGTRPVSTGSLSKLSATGAKSSAAGGVVKPRGSTAGLVSPRGSVYATSGNLPKLSRENSETRLSYRREGSSSSLRSTSSGSSTPARRRSSSSSLQGATTAADLKKFFKIGDRVLVSGSKPGAIAFIGETKFAKGDWAGVVLDEPTGKNDGCIGGVRYFECKALHGVFTKLEKITKINQVPETIQHSDGPTTALEIGDRVVVSGTKIGTVRYVGTTGFAKGDWAGVELDEPLGKNDGAVAGTRYFRCEQDFGLFAPVHKVIKTGKKESTKLLTSPPPSQKLPSLSIPSEVLHENVLKSLSETNQIQASTENSLSSSETTPLSLSSASTLGQKYKIEDGVSPAKLAPAHVSLQVAALQEALQEREREIQTLLEERDFERIEVANATSQVSKAEEELANVRKQHEESVVKSTKSIETLKSLIDIAEKEKADLALQVDDEKRKNEDLLFKLEEEEITLGDELKTEEMQIKELKQKLQENEENVTRLTTELEKTKASNSSSEAKNEEMEFQMIETSEELLSVKQLLEESQDKVKHLENQLKTFEETSLAQTKESSQSIRSLSEKIEQLEKDIENSHDKNKEHETKLYNTNSDLKKAQDENKILKLQVEDLTTKLFSKENEFESMSDELKHIKSATLELQRQLQLSEAKSMNLSSDKTKLENEIAELMKNSGNNSERLTYLNEQLREKDRYG